MRLDHGESSLLSGGGFALFIYKLYLANPKLENLPVGTRDIDSLIPRSVPEISKKNIAKYLNEVGFYVRFYYNSHKAVVFISLSALTRRKKLQPYSEIFAS